MKFIIDLTEKQATDFLMFTTGETDIEDCEIERGIKIATDWLRGFGNPKEGE